MMVFRIQNNTFAARAEASNNGKFDRFKWVERSSPSGGAAGINSSSRRRVRLFIDLSNKELLNADFMLSKSGKMRERETIKSVPKTVKHKTQHRVTKCNKCIAK